MNQLNSPLERFQQQFSAQAGQITQNFAPPGEWNGAQGMLLPLRRPGDGIFFSPVAPPNQIGGRIANYMLSNMPQFGPLGGLIQQLMSLMQQLAGMLSGGGSQAPLYNDATASSTGDPHLAFNGTLANGQTQNSHFDSMVSHGDFLDSDSFAGGYQVSTQVTAPNPSGVTTNQSATITSNYGATQVSLDRSGNASTTEKGQAVTIAAGQTLDLGNGETVTKNNDGSLSVINVNGLGGTVNTTLRANGGGVDVTTSAHDVDLGGDITQGPPQPPPEPQIWGGGFMEPLNRQRAYLGHFANLENRA